jgi:sigma-B regulation protein RsbU (phosphoserine phosphatase)
MLPPRDTAEAIPAQSVQVDKQSVLGTSDQPEAGRILLVEGGVDLEGTQGLSVRGQLAGQGHVLEMAGSESEALNLLRTFDPEMVISAARLSDVDGVALCRQLRSDPRHHQTHFLLIEERSGTVQRSDAHEAGVDGVLSQPVRSWELIDQVKAGLRITRLRRELNALRDQLALSKQRIREDLEVVGAIQRDLLPKESKARDLRCSVIYTPCQECGGDYYDFLPMGGNRTGLVVADVSGHGAPAMVAMAIIRSLTHTVLPTARSPAEALTEMNRALWSHLPTEQYATMFLGEWDSETRLLRYSTAGHFSPMVVRASDGTCSILPECQGYPLKLIGSEIAYQLREQRLEPGDRLAMFTDGVVECFNEWRQQFGLKRLAETLEKHAKAPLNEMGAAVVEDLMRFSGAPDWDDDVTLVLVEVL